MWIKYYKGTIYANSLNCHNYNYTINTKCLKLQEKNTIWIYRISICFIHMAHNSNNSPLFNVTIAAFCTSNNHMRCATSNQLKYVIT